MNFSVTNYQKSGLVGRVLKSEFVKRINELDFPNNNLKSHSISIVFVSNLEIKRLNNEWRQKNSATDVLSFNLDDESLLGELYISPEYVRLNYKRYERKYEIELLRLIVHGTLHLLGYNHADEFVKNEKNTYTEEMFGIQEKLLSQLLLSLEIKI
jgi:probable rRNA maturation factor